MMRKDIMVDIETLGKKEGASIFQISAVVFDITTGKVLDSIDLIGDIEKYYMLNTDGSTLKWWLNTNKELLSELLNKGTLTEDELAEKFHEWLTLHSEKKNNSDLYLWGNGILFDNHKIKAFFEDNLLEYPILYKNDRDVRTILELASMKSGLSEKEIKDSVTSDEEVLHNALDDVKYQVRLVSKCYDILMNNTEVY